MGTAVDTVAGTVDTAGTLLAVVRNHLADYTADYTSPVMGPGIATDGFRMLQTIGVI